MEQAITARHAPCESFIHPLINGQLEEKISLAEGLQEAGRWTIHHTIIRGFGGRVDNSPWQAHLSLILKLAI